MTRAYPKIFCLAGLSLALGVSFCPSAFSQTYPDKPITIYCGYAPGASTDVSARAIASGAEKLLGVPVVVDNKPGGSTTVCAGIVASKKPDGYSLGVLSEGALTVSPHLQKLAYDPLKDFTYLSYYAYYLGVVVVHKDSPIKNIQEFIAHAKANPGLSYSSTGMYTRQHLALERFIECKGLTFKHIPTKGASEASNILLGKHCDFSIGSSQITFVKQGVFRLLMLVTAEKRNPLYPDTPIPKDFGCPDVPPAGLIVVGPKGMPPAISKKLGEVIRKVTEEPSFQKVLASFDLPYDYKDQAELEKKIPSDYAMFRDFLKKMGVKKSD
ncbi:MAG: tripartite tricarboxylate transporter substrate binding protein [Deltaproteobacteria bacterium]|nr:tripartite tricarboxylate transporter substrate binding protein [Deltaproteobacteria bacterium]